MAYNAINNNEIDTDSPVTASLSSRWRDNPLAIASHDDSAAVAPRVHCDAAAGNASALASTAAVGSVLRVSSTASPDGHGNLVVPIDQGDRYITAAQTTGVDGSLSITLPDPDATWLIVATYSSDEQEGNEAHGNGQCIVAGGSITHQFTAYGYARGGAMLSSFDTSSFSKSGSIITFTCGGTFNINGRIGLCAVRID